ncbi:MAG TPA: hypothetical protein VHU15_07940 [Stellaceae bacterium]|jgi:hypothetical protein|nr:hypothetical protein [Stellaceae bacterium]
MTKTCFVIGPIGEVGSPIRTAADGFIEYIVGRCPALAEFDYGPAVRADRLSEPGRITSQIIRLLLDSDLVVADLSGNNPNVYYELSLRHAIGKPVIHMAEQGTIPSFDIRDNRTIFYSMDIRVVEAAREQLADQIRRVHDTDYKPMNPILETIGLINLENRKDPGADLIASIVRNIEGVNANVERLTSTVNTLVRADNLRTLAASMGTPSVLSGLGAPYGWGATAMGSGKGILSGLLADAAPLNSSSTSSGGGGDEPNPAPDEHTADPPQDGGPKRSQH